jgi:hypothetical protein
MRNSNRRFAGSWQSVLLGMLIFAMVVPPAAAAPPLSWSTYLGGSRNDVGTAIAAWEGTTYVAGTTFSTDYPTFGVSSSKNEETTSDTFVTALGPLGNPVYSTYVSLGEGNETVAGIEIAPDGSAYVAGTASIGQNGQALVVAKLDPWGNLAWTRQELGWTEDFSAWIEVIDLGVDGQGNVYVVGFDANDYNAGLFLWRLGPDGSPHYRLDFDRYSFYLDHVDGDAFGNAYLSGSTENTNLPNPTGPAPDSLNGFVMKISPAGSILWSAYLGGSMVDAAGDVAVAPDGSVAVTGVVTYDLPLLNPLQTEPDDAFLVRLAPSGEPLSSTYLPVDSASDLEVTDAGIHMIVSDDENVSSFRQSLDAVCGRFFLVTLNEQASALVAATCLDSLEIPGDRYIPRMAADSTGISLTGPARTGMPVKNAWQPAPAGGGDAFAAKLGPNNSPVCSAATASPASLWPADGRFISVLVGGVTDEDGDAVTISLTSIYQDEWLTVSGTPDATGLGTSRARLRASRLNGGDGRVYHLRFRATDPRGGFCTGLVKVCVPPTQGGTCRDGGARVDSTRAW